VNVPSQNAGYRPAHSRGKGVIEIARDAFDDMVTLLQTELQLLRAEVAEKLTFSLLSVSLIAAGALLLMATIVLLLQAAIAVLVAYGFSMPVAILLVAGGALLLGGGLVWVGFNNLRPERLAPTRTLAQLQKDADLTTME
jgi:uncharacterized membrane protein YqjE